MHTAVDYYYDYARCSLAFGGVVLHWHSEDGLGCVESKVVYQLYFFHLRCTYVQAIKIKHV